MRPLYFLPLTSLLLLPACQKKQAAGGPPQMPPAAVTFVSAATETVSITRQLPGRIDPVRLAEVRARVGGILLEKTFQEGADVKAGDVLFKIDPAPLEAVKENAAAALARAEATLHQNQTQLDRYKELVTSNAVSKQAYDNAESAVKVAEAELKAAAAALKTAELNLGYATVTAPISGRVGRAQVTEGALVGEGETTLMAVIQQLDPIYFDFTQSSADLLALQRAMKSGEIQAEQGKTAAKLLLEDGTEYSQSGKILFSEAVVDPTTGMVTLRAEFPNPEKILLPGMFARVRVVQAVKENVVTVPQRTVTRTQGGGGSVMVIDESNHAQIRMIQTDNAVGDKWVVTSGLKAGEKVIVEGLLKARPGAPVVPEPFQPAKAATSQAEAQDGKKG
ncbi:efflux RND transporter periplasmic adaptor subunit [Luteolibacter sp. GHJ8]|uniref:Efflux RND transporter periplasmic adaptor subunit n=1 Tax=Luteolibacter rhizosphaerae TaxID=2989719 RepID=A0ABT3GCC5_9BACT|nr:efflux RND transporter periplasmic adaptor subunit [Luteolibacter rhizosphaerae]MCW1916865.1 efflux RND transporter periplasmic adaptor subunit [Luteolibacter rhizosphaerae]